MEEERFDYEKDDATRFVDNLKDRVHDLYDKNEELKEEIERLNNNWNKLKKWIEEYRNETGLSEYETGISDALYDILKKMKALQGSDKE